MGNFDFKCFINRASFMGNPVACLFYKKEEKMRKKLAKVFSFKKKK